MSPRPRSHDSSSNRLSLSLYANDKWHRRSQNKLPELSDTTTSWQDSPGIHFNSHCFGCFYRTFETSIVIICHGNFILCSINKSRTSILWRHFYGSRSWKFGALKTATTYSYYCSVLLNIALSIIIFISSFLHYYFTYGSNFK